MYVFPAVSALVSFWFGARVLGRYRRRRGPHHLAWGASLLMSGVASVAYILAVALEGSPFWFRVYYLFGALLTAAYLGLGSVYLAWGRRVGDPVMWAVVALSLLGAILLWRAPVDMQALAALAGGPGVGILQLGAARLILILLNTFGAVAVVGIALRSAYRLLRRRAPAAFVAGHGLIALGVLVLAKAGSLSAVGLEGGFWLLTALGWVVTFAGFLVVERARAASPQAPHRRAS